ncbi:MAG: helicase-exonuclease AddAB subunit AddA [Lachnospiraceae bacterium]|nr:helicase-exonuclease AddAB subunit AddA [Lachnospiraceae bacterium]
MKFTPKQQEVITTRNKNILVSAAAGSGKTSVLVERILSMITDTESPVDIDRFLIVTFTSAAASEMRERIHRSILNRLEECPSDANLQKQSALIHNAQITTIDSFCLFLLRNHFHEIGLDPAFRVGDPGEIKLLEKEVLEQTLEQFYQEGESEFLYFTDAYCPDGKDGKIEKLVEELYKFSMSHPWPEEWLTECEEKIETLDEESVMQTEWMKFGLQLAAEKLQRAMDMAQSALALCNRADGPYMYVDNITSDLEILTSLADAMEGMSGAASYHDVGEAVQKPGWQRLSAKKDESVSQECKDIVKDMRDAYKKLVADVAESMFADTNLAELIAKEKEAGRLEKVLLRITRTYIENLAAVKKEKNVLDFSDMEHYALQILVQDGMPTRTAEAYRDYYKAVMIDEYQDSNMVQELILASISMQEKGNCNRFMVGDMKQSIYRFRMARPEIFMEKYDAYKGDSEEDSLICLKQNFRSRKEVLDSTNAVFSEIMQPQIGGVVYDDEAALYIGAQYPETEGCETELCLALTEGTGEEKRSAEAYMIAQKIKWLKENFKIDGRQTQYRDIVILLRSGSGVDERIKEILMSEGIPAHVTSKTGYFSAPEVSQLMDLLRVMNNPYDDIALCSVATSVFFEMTNEELALITAVTERGMSLYERFVAVATQGQLVIGVSQCLPETTVQKVKDSLLVLQELRNESVVCSMTELINKIIARFHYTEYVTALPAGEQRKANVEMFVQKTVDFEKTSYHGLFHFLRYMEQLKKYEVDFGEAATLTETADVVRIMTIHKSKGLEFPICFVAGLDKKYNMRDTTAPFLLDADWGVAANRVRPQEHTTAKTMRKMMFARKMKRDSLGEELRVLYVAMTRAKEKLILTAAADADMDIDAVCRQLQTMCGRAEEKIPLDMIENAKGALDHLLLAYSRNRQCFSVRTVREEQIQRKQVQHLSGRMLREERVRMLTGMETEVAGAQNAIETELTQRFAYAYPHDNLASLYTKTSVSELKHAAMEEDGVRVLFETEEKEQEYYPAFMRQQETVHEGAARGSAMHRVLELIDFAHAIGESRERLDADISRFVQEGRMTEEYARLILRDKVVAFLQSDMAKRMAAAQEKQRLFKEQPFVLSVSASLLDEKFPEEEKVLIQGIIDVYFEEDDEITILDYKTDRVDTLLELKRRYKTQLDYYEEAISQLTGKKVKEKVLYSFALMDQISWK